MSCVGPDTILMCMNFQIDCRNIFIKLLESSSYDIGLTTTVLSYKVNCEIRRIVLN